MTEELWFSGAVIIGFMFVGSWLENINGKHGRIDDLLTPFPFGVAGLLAMVAERAFA